MKDSPLRRERRKRGVGIREMAELVDYDKGDLSRVEREMKPARTVEWLANRYELVLGIERDSLVEECGTLPKGLMSAAAARGKRCFLFLARDLLDYLHVTVRTANYTRIGSPVTA